MKSLLKVIGSLFIFLFFINLGCSRTVPNYIQKFAGCKEFCPKRVALLFSKDSINVGKLCPVALRIVEKKKIFKKVLGCSLEREDPKKVLDKYLEKLFLVGISDPSLCKKIGDQFGTEALLILSVEDYKYTHTQKEKFAKVTLCLRYVRTSDGKILWIGCHTERKKYRFRKPKLERVFSNTFSILIDSLFKKEHHFGGII